MTSLTPLHAYCHFLNVHKPPGMTSFAVVSRVRRMAETRRVGHLGTLDPTAEGVLPLALGSATRLIEYVDGDKRYVAEITLGIRTDTLDAAGRVTATMDATHVTRDDVLQALSRIAAAPTQVPPMASALRHAGRRLYELFREGRALDIPPRPVRIDAIALNAFETASALKEETRPAAAPLPDGCVRVTIDIQCGAGTYIRSIARDLGDILGCGGHLSGLLRTRRGPFLLEGAVSLDRLEREGIAAHLMAPRQVLIGVPWFVLQPDTVSAVRHGGRIAMHRVEIMNASLPEDRTFGRQDGASELSGTVSRNPSAAWQTADTSSETPIEGASCGMSRAVRGPVCALSDERGELVAIARLSADEIWPLKVFVGAEGDLS